MATAGTMSRQSVWPSNPQRTDCVVIRPSSTPPALEIAPQTRKSVAFDNTTFCRQPNINSLDNNATSIDTVVNSNEIVFITVALGIALKLLLKLKAVILSKTWPLVAANVRESPDKHTVYLASSRDVALTSFMQVDVGI